MITATDRHARAAGEADAATGLDALWQRVATLEREVARLTAVDAKRRAPTIAILRRLLPAIAGAFGSDAWRASEAKAHPALAPIVGTWNARRMGIFCAKADGLIVDGRMLERVGVEGHAALWRVVGVL
jgi:hypothetical protein